MLKTQQSLLPPKLSVATILIVPPLLCLTRLLVVLRWLGENDSLSWRGIRISCLLQGYCLVSCSTLLLWDLVPLFSMYIVSKPLLLKVWQGLITSDVECTRFYTLCC